MDKAHRNRIIAARHELLTPITNPTTAQALLDAINLLAYYLPLDTDLLGLRGELTAIRHFAQLGYRVTWTSLQQAGAPFDLLIENTTERVLVEVKHRLNRKHRAISPKKLDQLAKALVAYHADHILFFIVNGSDATYTLSYRPGA